MVVPAAMVRRNGHHAWMRGIGQGNRLWRAEVVLRVPGHDADLNQQRLLDAVADRAMPLDADDVPGVQDLRATWSYDMQPPKPDSGVGVAFWVLADSVGVAADITWQTVESAALTFMPDVSLWDLRLIPGEAILSAPDGGTPLTR